MAKDNRTPLQLSLGVSLRDEATFANFWCATDNAPVLHTLKRFAEMPGGKADETNIVIWGSKGAGLTHLLQACCHVAFESRQSFQYLPLEDLLNFAPEKVFEGLDACQLVCLDNLDCIVGKPRWQRALFHLYNRLRENQHRLLLACHGSPAAMSIELADLKSRIMGSVVFQVQPLTDEGKCAAMVARAHNRGMELPEDVARFILARVSRTATELFDLLELLDEASLQQQRKLTIPFVKSLLKL